MPWSKASASPSGPTPKLDPRPMRPTTRSVCGRRTCGSNDIGGHGITAGGGDQSGPARCSIRGVRRLGALLLASLLGALAAGSRADPPEDAAGAGLLPGQLLLRAEPEPVVRRLLEQKVVVLDDDGELVRAFVLFDRPAAR